MKAPLEGIKVVEWSMYATGPMAGVVLGDLGADVIKIEDASVGGDPPRGMRFVAGVADCAMPGDRNAYFEVMNWNKRSITLNLKHPKGREIAFQLLDKADVFLCNIRPPVVRKLGLDYETVSQRNPRIVYAIASGYGERGPQGDRAGNDYTGQARSGMMWGAGTVDDPPFYHTGGFPDMGGATLLSHAVITALLARERHGVGQKVEMSNLSAAMWMQYWAMGIVLLTGNPWPRIDRRKPGNPLYNHYPCQDGEWIALSAILPQNWPTFCQLVGLDHLLEDERFQTVDNRRINALELNKILDERFMTRPRHEWEEILARDPSMIFERVQRLEDLADDPQVLANEYVIEMDHPVYGRCKVQNFPIRFSKTSPKPRRAAPELGDSNFEILVNELGYSPEDVADFMSEGAL